MKRLTTQKFATVLGLGFGLAALATPAQAQTVSTVMTGLNSPRGLAFGPEGGLYVTEAGIGGDQSLCTILGGNPANKNCYTETGSVTRLYKGKQERIATGLPSVYNTSRFDVVGPNDISFQGRGNTYITLGWGGEPAAREGLGKVGGLVGTLINMQPNGKWRVDTDIADYEAANNPAGGPVDSNPYGVLATPGDTYVTDAGGNSLLRVKANGNVSLIATFGPIPVVPPLPAAPPVAEAVPTEVVQGPDGALYVSTLTGFPFANNIARVYRVVPGEAPTVFREGFRTIIDIAFGPDGSLYVLEHSQTRADNTPPPQLFAAPGRIVKVAPNGTRSFINTGSTVLSRPTSLVVDDANVIYVTNNGTGPAGAGTVLKIVQ